MKRFFWICGVVLVMCTAATMYMASCESTYIKRWAPESVVIKGQFPLSGQLTTTRIHSPTGQRKFGKSDEIRYELQLQPDNEDGSWAPQVTEFLETQKQRKPRINFSNNDEGRMLGSTELNLQPEIIEEKTYYTARGSFGSPAAFKSATNWNIVWDEPMPAVPKAKYTGPIRRRFLPDQPMQPVQPMQPGQPIQPGQPMQGQWVNPPQASPIQPIPIPKAKPVPTKKQPSATTPAPQTQPKTTPSATPTKP